MKNHEPCRICGAKETTLFLEGIRNDEHGGVFRCNHCGISFLEKRFFEAEVIEEQYRQKYIYEPVVDPLRGTPYDIYAARVRQIEGYLDPEKTTLFEIGSGPGYFVRAVIDRVKRVVALELNGSQADHCRKTYGIEVYSDLLDKIDLDEQFDVVCMLAVLEHVPDPRALIQQAMDHVKPGGILFIEVPNEREALMDIYRLPGQAGFWYRKTHLFNFSQDSLLWLLQDMGFDQIDTRLIQAYSLGNHLHWIYTRKGQANISEGYRMTLPVDLPDDLAVTPALERFFERIDNEYRQLLVDHGHSDVLAVVIRK